MKQLILTYEIINLNFFLVFSLYILIEKFYQAYIKCFCCTIKYLGPTYIYQQHSTVENVG